MSLQLLSQHQEWKLVDPGKDIRGRKVLSSGGASHGRVSDMVVDTDDQRISRICTDTGEMFPVEPLEIRGDTVIMHESDAVPEAPVMCGVMSVVRAQPTWIVAGADLRHTGIHGVDGDIGKLSDIYFDDERWTIRYLVVRTSKKWLLGRKVLIAPDAMIESDNPAERINLNLTRDQIRNSPEIDTDRPVSRQHQNMLAAYYGWPGVGIGMFPNGVVGPSYTYPGGHYAHTEFPPLAPQAAPDADPHLRSAKEVADYRVWVSDSHIGDMADFVYDFREDVVRSIVFRTGDRDVTLPVRVVQSIRWAERIVSIRLS